MQMEHSKVRNIRDYMEYDIRKNSIKKVISE